MFSDSADRGAAAVDFVLVGSLLTLFFLALLQLGVDLYVRNVLAGCAAEGASYAAASNIESPTAAARRTDQLINSALGKRYDHATATMSASNTDGRQLITVKVSAHLPLLAWFLPSGPTVRVTGHALAEPAS